MASLNAMHDELVQMRRTDDVVFQTRTVISSGFGDYVIYFRNLPRIEQITRAIGAFVAWGSLILAVVAVFQSPQSFVAWASLGLSTFVLTQTLLEKIPISENQTLLPKAANASLS